MPPNTPRPISRRVQARFFKIINVLMRNILNLPIETPLGKRLMLVHHFGRKTGKHYCQPVSYVLDGSDLLTPGGGRWTLNLHECQPVSIRLRGHDILALPELVADPNEVERLLKVMSKVNPTLQRFVRIPKNENGDLDPQSLAAAIDHGFLVVRWHLFC